MIGRKAKMVRKAMGVFRSKIQDEHLFLKGDSCIVVRDLSYFIVC